MKLTRILPKKLAIAWQEYDLNKIESHYKYHSMMAQGFKEMLDEARQELDRLNGDYT